MTVKPEFIKSEIELAERDYERLTLDPMQREKVGQLASICIKYVPIPEMAMKGFISRAMREWQVENRANFKDTLNWSKNEQIKLAKDIFEIVKITLRRFLIKKEQEPALDAGINAALNFLLEAIRNQ